METLEKMEGGNNQEEAGEEGQETGEEEEGEGETEKKKAENFQVSNPMDLRPAQMVPSGLPDGPEWPQS